MYLSCILLTKFPKFLFKTLKNLMYFNVSEGQYINIIESLRLFSLIYKDKKFFIIYTDICRFRESIELAFYFEQ